MSGIELIAPTALALFGVVGGVSLLRKHNKDSKPQAYLKRGDAVAQAEYKTRKRARDEATLDVEKSWEFLYDVTHKVTAEFTEDDKVAALNVGKQLLQADCNYSHVPKYGIRRTRAPVVEGEGRQADTFRA